MKKKIFTFVAIFTIATSVTFIYAEGTETSTLSDSAEAAACNPSLKELLNGVIEVTVCNRRTTEKDDNNQIRCASEARTKCTFDNRY
jgi:hypothetical protein